MKYFENQDVIQNFVNYVEIVRYNYEEQKGKISDKLKETAKSVLRQLNDTHLEIQNNEKIISHKKILEKILNKNLPLN